MKRLSQTLRVLLALIVALFSNGVLSSVAVYAAGKDNGAPQPVWCQLTGNTWEAQQGSSNNNPNRFPLEQLPPNSPSDMYIDPTTGQVWTSNSSFDQMKGVLDAECAEQYSTVTASAPSVTPVCGPNNDTVTFAVTPNVTYSQTGWVGGSNTISATAAAGYVLTSTTSWTYTDTGIAGCTTVSPVAPTFDDVCGVNGDTYTITATTGVTYYVNGVVVTTYGTFPASGTVTITAVANSGYILGTYPVGGWTHTYEGNCVAEVPATPAPVDPCGLNNAYWALPKDTDTYTWSIVEGELVATTVANYEFAPGVTTKNFGAAIDSGKRCVVETPATPSQTDPCGLANAYWTLPRDNDQVTWAVLEGELVATTTADYEFADGSTSINYGAPTESGNLCATVVTPVGSDFCGDKYDMISYAGAIGVSYSEEWNDAHTSVTITATADEGYEIAPETVTSWILEFPNNEDCQKITICHATDSTTNPYDRITVSVNAADGVSGNSGREADHYSHTGPIYYEGIDDTWGDIIPAIEGVHDGRNLTTLGQYILDHDCLVPAESVAQYELAPCTFNTNSTDIIKVTITNTADESGGDVTYVVSLGSSEALTKTITLADGESMTVSFDGLSSMSYPLAITASDGTVFEPATIAVGKCTFTPQVLGTSTQKPQVLPATIADTGASESSLYTLLGVMLSALTYYLVLRRQESQRYNQ